MKLLLNPFMLLLYGGLILTIGDIIMKKWTITNNSPTYLLGLAVYIIGLNFLAFSFKSKNIAVASVIFIVFNVTSLSLISWLIFGQKLSTTEIIGIALAMIAVVILEIGSGSGA